METNISQVIFFNDSSFNGAVVSTEARYNLIENIALCLILGGIIISTIIGNILVCVSIFLVRKLRRPGNYLLVSLAVSDLCVALLVMPMALIYEIKGKWIFSEIACNIWVSLDVLSCTSSILNLCMIAVDRYYAITKPLKYGVKRTPRRMTILIILVWCLAAMICLPPLLIIGNEHTQKEDGKIVNNICLVSQDISYQIYATICSFYIPLIVMIMVYYKVFRAAQRIVNEEKRAQSHLELNRYYEINNVNHRPSSTSTNTVGSLEQTIDKYFKTKNGNSPQFPMLSLLSKEPTKNQKHSIISVQKKLRFHLAKERKASTTLGIIMSVFIFCWLPFFILAITRPFLIETTSVLNTLSSIFLWLGYTNSLFNPIIYAVSNRDFRKPFKAILYLHCASLNNIMREDFYHSQYGDPEQCATRCHSYIEAEGEEDKMPEAGANRETLL